MIRSPAVILALLTGLNFLNYIDRMILSAVLPRIQEDLKLSNFEGGLLATAFLIGYFATSPYFGVRADRGQRKTLIAAGVFIWSMATIASGLSTGLYSLLAARVVVGIGEASFAVLAPTIIDDISPPHRKGRNLAVFYLALPMGSALGYLMGGFVQEHWGWQAAFFVGGVPGALLAVTCVFIEEPARKLAEAKINIVSAARSLMKVVMYRRAVFGYCAHTAAVGAFSYWAPKFLYQHFEMNLASANVWFGAITVNAGLIATIIGGRLADRAVAALPAVPAGSAHDAPENVAVVDALLRICGLGLWVAAPLVVVALLAPSPIFFFTVTFVVELGLFISVAPINAAMLRGVPIELRASSMAVGIFAIHMFGDLWTPPLVGLLADVVPIVMAMMSLPVMLGVGALIWWPAHRLFARRQARR
jgi:MFS transporter, Spinster family, sphingosine-1-phosphate transporter